MSTTLIYKGVWVSTTSYKTDDIVWLDVSGTDKSYKAKRDNSNKAPNTETDDWEYLYDGKHKFVKPAGVSKVEVLAVAGGGGGGGGTPGAGAGAGGLLYNDDFSVADDVAVTVGAGGAGGAGIADGINGADSVFSTLTTKGGGGGVRMITGGVDGKAGGSGGGATRYNAGSRSGGAAEAGQGNRGGNVVIDSNVWATGGGGGAGAQGTDADAGDFISPGGVGLDYSAKFGTSVGVNGWFAGGGGGGRYPSTPAGAGGTGGGGDGGGWGASPGEDGSPGVANTGGGGGGGVNGGNGGSGIVIVKYEETPTATVGQNLQPLLGVG